MIKPSAITNEARAYVEEKVRRLAEQRNVCTLLAVESGSRAWGFPSQDSDYDVRFIYVRNADDYLSVETFRDVIETSLADDASLGVPLDLNGWDVKKSLWLAVKSNAVLVEWLNSPIRYVEDKKASSLLREFSDSCVNLQSLAYHYDRMAGNAWERILESGDAPKLKLYCYALRPALALEWIRRFSETPPMDIYALCNRLKPNRNLVEEISKLIAVKSSAGEGALTPRIDLFDEFIKLTLDEKTTKPNVAAPSQEHVIEANRLFKTLLSHLSVVSKLNN